jgi:glyoxylase-like metal-dependent hydrolase (beta-lactamase superfamily II)
MPEGVFQWHPGAEQCTPETTRTESTRIEDGLFALRQNPCVDYEANLVYVVVGTKRVLLIDTGAVEGDAAKPLVEQVAALRTLPGGEMLPLLVVHTHSHQDHRAGDAEFARLPATAFVAPDGAAVPEEIDLGDRVVQVIPTPGHLPDHVAIYDPRTRALFTGDFLLLGRLLVDDLDDYRQSAQRVAEFARTHPVSHVLGAHIELDVHGNAYPGGASFHPHERLAPLTAQDLHDLPDALAQFNGFYSRYPNYIVVDPMHNLLALAAGVVTVLASLTWLARRWWKRRRAGKASAA